MRNRTGGASRRRNATGGKLLAVPFETIFEYLQARQGSADAASQNASHGRFGNRDRALCVAQLLERPPFPPLSCFFIRGPAQLLRLVSMKVGVCGPNAALYLAAAVSDFFVPWCGRQ